MPRTWSGALALVALAATGFECPVGHHSAPGDPMLDRDVTLLGSNEVLEIPAGTPAILPGLDGELGTDDDVAFGWAWGDVDLVIRGGITAFSGPFPAPASLAALPEATAEPFGEGTPLPFVIAASNGHYSPAAGNPVNPPSLTGVPMLALAFGDLDGDGVIGVTHLDGNALDLEIEEEELRVLGRRFAPSSGGRASGELFVSAGGPPGAELLVALGAAAYAGPFDPQHFGGKVPNGPLVMTKLPFVPLTRPQDVVDGNAPGSASPDALVGVEVAEAYTPQPLDPAVREAFTLRPGGHPSIDFAKARSGAFARFGLARVPDLATYRSLPGRPLRPGLDAAGNRAVYEVLEQLFLPDDGAASQIVARVVPLDRLGNIAALGAGKTVSLRAGGGVAIIAPDLDHDPTTETITVSNARGVAVTLDDASPGINPDDPDGFLEIESAEGLLRLEVFLPDADVDDSGDVDAADVALVQAARNARLGDADYEPRLDLSGDGRIRNEDVDLVEARVGENLPVP